MNPTPEIEVKLLAGIPAVLTDVLTDASLQRFRQGGVVRKFLDAFYMDTRDLRLAAVRTAYRVRREGEVWKATLKQGKRSEGGMSVRDEWEVAVEGPAADFSVFDDADIAAFLEDTIDGRSLVVLFEVRVERRILNLLLPDGTAVELAADTGEIICRDLRAPICEIELELKKGTPEGLMPLMAALRKKFSLELGELSKFARGMELLEKQRELPLMAASRVFADRFGC